MNRQIGGAAEVEFSSRKGQGMCDGAPVGCGPGHEGARRSERYLRPVIGQVDARSSAGHGRERHGNNPTEGTSSNVVGRQRAWIARRRVNHRHPIVEKGDGADD